jgi:tetratricopeptide (TPR) repeat protein
MAIWAQGCSGTLETQEETLLDSAKEKYDQGDFAGAIRDYSQAIALRPGDGRPYRDRGLAREGMGDLMGALNDLDTAVVLLPSNSVLKLRVEAQIAILDSLQSTATDSAAADKVLLRMQIVTTRILIIDNLDKMIFQERYNERENPWAHGERGRLRFDKGDAQGAIEDFNQVLALESDADWAYYNRGLAEAALGDYPAAIQDFTRVLKNDDSDGWAFYQRGLARIYSGDYDEGCSDLEQAMQLGVEESGSVMEELCR